MEARVESRFGLIKKTLEADAANAKALTLQAATGPTSAGDELPEIEAKLQEDLETLRQYREAVEQANIPRVLDEDAAGILKDIAKRKFVDPDGNEQTVYHRGRAPLPLYQTWNAR